MAARFVPLLFGFGSTGQITAGAPAAFAGSAIPAAAWRRTETTSHAAHHLFHFFFRDGSVTILINLLQASAHLFGDFITGELAVLVLISHLEHARKELARIPIGRPAETWPSGRAAATLCIGAPALGTVPITSIGGIGLVAIDVATEQGDHFVARYIAVTIGVGSHDDAAQSRSDLFG